MTKLHDLLQPYVDDGGIPGAVALVAGADGRSEVAAVGAAGLAGGAPMARDSIFRIASLTKPVTAAALLMLIEDGRVALDAPVDRWLPELADPVVVRTPAGPVDDVVPAVRPITVFDLLTSRAGYGFPADFSLPAVQALAAVQKDGREPQSFLPADAWLAALARVPLLYQPGEVWLYDTCSTLQGLLIGRVTGGSPADFLAERVFGPLAMADTGFVVPAAERARFTTYYRVGESGALEEADAPGGQWSSPPPQPLGNGGLVSTLDDYHAFLRLLLAGGVSPAGRRLLSAESVRQLTTNHLTERQRALGRLFLEGQGWGYGGSVDVETTDPWTVPGRYGWVGGTGTSAYIVPATGAVSVLLTQVGARGPEASPLMRGFWRYAAGV